LAQSPLLLYGSMAKRRTTTSKKKPTPGIYSVYVIELSRACTREPCALAPVYVGQTAHPPDHRFSQHKAGGILAAPKAHKFGVRLRPDLVKGIGPFNSRKKAEAAEKMVAGALERQGRKVFWG
jgi:hypothetical protein